MRQRLIPVSLITAILLTILTGCGSSRFVLTEPSSFDLSDEPIRLVRSGVDFVISSDDRKVSVVMRNASNIPIELTDQSAVFRPDGAQVPIAPQQIEPGQTLTILLPPTVLDVAAGSAMPDEPMFSGPSDEPGYIAQRGQPVLNRPGPRTGLSAWKWPVDRAVRLRLSLDLGTETVLHDLVFRRVRN